MWINFKKLKATWVSLKVQTSTKRKLTEVLLGLGSDWDLNRGRGETTEVLRQRRRRTGFGGSENGFGGERGGHDQDQSRRKMNERERFKRRRNGVGEGVWWLCLESIVMAFVWSSSLCKSNPPPTNTNPDDMNQTHLKTFLFVQNSKLNQIRTRTEPNHANFGYLLRFWFIFQLKR